MVIELRVSEQTKAAYSESLELISRLSLLSEEERKVEYGKYQWMFPKSKRFITLDDQLGSRQDYRRKFREWFFVVSKYIFLPTHMGECCYSIFQERFVAADGEKKPNSDRYSQKVILALGMLGYLTKIKCNYSNCSKGNKHGMVFEVDMLKLNQWNQELNFVEKIERDDVELEDCADWRWKDQYHTIMDVKADAKYLEKSIKNIADFHQYEEDNKEKLKRDIKFCVWESLVNLSNKSSYDIIARHKEDDYGGRFYTLMTNLKKIVRHHCIKIDNERIAEVDVSSAQPTFLGLFIKEKYGADSEWLNHCIRGDFYEWVKEICRTKVDRSKVKEYIMHYLYSYDNEYAEKAHSKVWKKGYWRFERKLNEYLEKNEPIIFDKIQWHKKNAEKDEKKKKMRNSLSRDLVKMEVKYIKYCISKLPPNFKFYTIHDCICCKRSDADFVRKIMEESSKELYNLTINLKIENDKDDEPKKAA